MAELAHPFTCDVCGVHKGEQNHWFRVWLLKGHRGVVVMAPWSSDPESTKAPAAGGFIFHCCGEEHALRKAGELLGAKPTAAAHPPE